VKLCSVLLVADKKNDFYGDQDGRIAGASLEGRTGKKGGILTRGKRGAGVGVPP